MPVKRTETARPATRGSCRRRQPHPTPISASAAPHLTDAEAKTLQQFTGPLLRDFKFMERMTEGERKAYDLGRERGRAELTPIILPPDADTKGRRVRIPKLELRNMPRYIGAVSKALERGEVTAQDARAMLYAAQMLLAAWNALGDALPDEDAKAKIGFIQAAAEELQEAIKKHTPRSIATLPPGKSNAPTKPASSRRTKHGKAAA